ncbi:MAG: hypothetical protein WAM44_17890 [Chthoniobacterales bacterium]
MTRILSGKEAQIEKQVERIGAALGVATLNNYEGMRRPSPQRDTALQERALSDPGRLLPIKMSNV